jgi:hypothetical protein
MASWTVAEEGIVINFPWSRLGNASSTVVLRTIFSICVCALPLVFCVLACLCCVAAAPE